jgi:hypothetical protein
MLHDQALRTAASASSILLLQGDAEARLLTDAAEALQSLFLDREMQLLRTWMTRPDWLDASGPAVPEPLVRLGALPADDVRALLEQPHRLVIFSLLPAVSAPPLRHRDGGAFLAHRGLTATWSADVAAVVAAECREVAPLSPHAAAAALEPVIERLQAKGTVAAVCTAFRHVAEPLEHRRQAGAPTLREQIRRINLEAARLSQRTGCFVLDLDRPLAQEGGESLGADCFGGDGRAAEIAIDEFAALVLDALPDDFLPSENA